MLVYYRIAFVDQFYFFLFCDFLSLMMTQKAIFLIDLLLEVDIKLWFI